MEQPVTQFSSSFITRRQATKSLLAFAGATTLAGCHSKQETAANGLIPIRLQADWYPQPEQGGYFNAVAKGFYKAEGLDVTILPLPAYGSALQIVTSGAADFGLGASDQILESVSKSLPLVGICATLQHDPQAVMVHQESPVHSFADLEGHTVAAQTGATWYRYVISKYHLKNVRETPSTHSIANFLADPNYIQQIFITSEPYFVTKAGGTFRTMLISGAGYDPYRVLFTRREFLDQHPDIVAKFVRATIKGWKDYINDPGPANELILKLNPSQNPEQMKFTLAALKDGGFVTEADPSGSQVGQMTADRWTATYKQLSELGIIRNPIDSASAYTLKFLS